jgi:serine/threonine protein kinase
MLETAQAGSSKTIFENGRQWEGRTVAGRFPLRQYLGASNRSAVFLTEWPEDLSRKAVIKLIAAGPHMDVQAMRLKLASRLSHSHLLQIFETGSCELNGEQFLYVVTEFADEALSEILPQRALTPGETREMLQPLLQALAYLHENGFAHARLRPSNILVVGEQLKLSSDSVCRPGVIDNVSENRPAYDAPEASREGCSPAGDVWSLGVVLCESLTRRLPVWTDRLQNEPSLPVGIPEPFAGIASHSVRRDPKSRWTVSHIFSKFQPTPAPVPARPKLEKQRIKLETQKIREKLEIIAKAGAEIVAKARNEIGSHIYAIGLVAVIAIAIVVASTLRRHPTATNISSSDQLVATGAEKPSPNPTHNSADRVSRQAQSIASPGQIVRQVLPDVTSSALRTIHGKVRVTVRVHTDGAGNVAKAEFVSAGPSRYFANHALEAAQDWKFATSNANAHVWVLQFIFQRSGTSVNPRPINS